MEEKDILVMSISRGHTMNNNSKTLEIFELCERLSELLGDKEAIADLQKLYDRHPEMFDSMKDVSHTIEEVVSNPEIIAKNRKARNEKDFIVAKRLNERKMADVGIRNDSGVNVIFHANKKHIKKFNKMKEEKQMLVEASSAKAAPTRSDHYASNSNELPKCHEAPSTSITTISQNSKHTAEPTTNKLDFTQKAIEFIKTNQSSHNRVKPSHTKDKDRS